ncbi:hypothetical protein [Paenibacillus anseongense]|uniref:hypothetical protein n=1 Tax=Paenibacillus anseongense TaxID=2682845 RepID=UPI002DBAAB45|nr:hypothetical protein [Paenibacillus anseongense]MEC0265128.1 hypothetical protein [Paenibacillus anseongense]
MANDLYSLGVRQALNGKGIADERIGYDPQSGSVTVDGINVIKPEYNDGGTTYTNEATFNNKYNQFLNNSKAQQLTNQFVNSNQQPTVNPYDSKINDLMNSITQKTNQTVDPYSSPQYAAAQAQLAKQSQQSTRAAQESLGESGFGRSTNLTDRVQHIQNDANDYMNTQMLPQIVSQLQAQKQNEVNGLYNMLNALAQQQSTVDTRQRNSNQDLYNVVDFLTGRQDHAEAAQFENDKFDYTKQHDQELMDYQKARDLIADEQYKQKFDEDVRRYGLDYALKKSIEEGQLSVSRANAQTAADNAKTSANSANFSKLMDIWQATGKAPAGLESMGIEAGAPLKGKDSSINLKEEISGLTDSLRSGKLTPASALQQLEEDFSLGLYTKPEYDQLKTTITKLAPSYSSPPSELTQEQADAIPSDAQLDKMAPKGVPILDWKSWYKDSRGRLSGVPFEQWQQLYGPRLEAKK